MPRDNSYPTRCGWRVRSSDTLALDLRDLPPGEYTLALGWTAPGTAERLEIDAPGAGRLAGPAADPAGPGHDPLTGGSTGPRRTANLTNFTFLMYCQSPWLTYNESS